MNFNLSTRNPWFKKLPCQQQPSIKEIMIGTTSSGISDQLREIYSICRCSWNVATYEWKAHNWKIEIISSQVSDKLHCIIVVSSTHRHEPDSNSHRQWGLALIAWVVVTPTTIRSHPRRPLVHPNFLNRFLPCLRCYAFNI